MNKIEELLFKTNVAHAVTAIHFSEQRITLSTAPWEQLHAISTADFLEVQITSVEIYADDADDLNLPWDIIGFECYRLAGRRWSFVLHTRGLEYCWEGAWPSLR